MGGPSFQGWGHDDKNARELFDETGQVDRARIVAPPPLKRWATRPQEYSSVDEKNCRLYVDLNLHSEGLLTVLHKRYGGTKHNYHMDCEWARLYSESNSDYSWLKKRRKDDGFLFFRNIIYIECNDNISHPLFVQMLLELMAFLRNKGARVVPACDFEDALNDPNGE